MAAIIVAEAAAWLLRPSGVLDPVAVEPASILSGEEIARAEDYRSGQRLLFVGGVAAQGVLLVLLIGGRPAAVRRVLERAGERPLLGG
ncbi:MAG: hypothetical protein FJW90_12500, partial [Actinobacteria bacterium]|nr:hypothetical protein [Actinomycetota bacterium]